MRKDYRSPEVQLLIKLQDDVILTSDDSPFEEDEEEED